jgi:hypothetical protein
VGLAVAAMLYLFSRVRRMASYDPVYAAIKVGDSREAVVAAMGEPQTVTDCSHTPFSDKKLERNIVLSAFKNMSTWS